MHKPVVCVVDDNAPLRASPCDLLESAGYLTRAYGCADDLLAQPLGHIDCVVTDIHMPGRDGIELLRTLTAPFEAKALLRLVAGCVGTTRLRC